MLNTLCTTARMRMRGLCRGRRKREGTFRGVEAGGVQEDGKAKKNLANRPSVQAGREHRTTHMCRGRRQGNTHTCTHTGTHAGTHAGTHTHNRQKHISKRGR